jgi:hypothetical protein
MVNRGLSVFGVVVPVCAVIRLWVSLESKNSTVVNGSQIGLFAAENAAMSYTLYCIFQLYVSTHDILHHMGTTPKFVAIKAILGIAVLQSMIIKVVIKRIITKRGYFTDEFLSEWWSDFALCCESILLALAQRSAYPVEELMDSDGAVAARRAAAKMHALELAATPKAGHGHGHGGHAHEEDDEAPRAVAVNIAQPVAGWRSEEAWPVGGAVAGGVPARARREDAPAQVALPPVRTGAGGGAVAALRPLQDQSELEYSETEQSEIDYEGPWRERSPRTGVVRPSGQ